MTIEVRFEIDALSISHMKPQGMEAKMHREYISMSLLERRENKHIGSTVCYAVFFLDRQKSLFPHYLQNTDTNTIHTRHGT